MHRQNPDDLLRRIKLDEESSDATLGRLKIFFGYAAGVGKTYAMLEAAHDAKDKGFDVVVGYLEPHQRPATSALADGLEQIPPAIIDHKGIKLREFDLDAALARHPQIVLVDELAHTNADECRHRKRYQDVEELLRAGINVYTTVNVQHIESLNDKVASITHVPVFERVPDRIFDQASSVELIDIEPDDLIDRLNAGKIYRSDQAKNALSNFFTKKNLAALREIALRRTADRLARNPLAAGLDVGDHLTDAGGDVLLYMTDDPGDVKAIRAASTMAQAYHGELTALVVQASRTGRDTDEQERGNLAANIELAEELGANVVTVYGEDVAFQIAQYAPAAGIGRIVIGTSANAGRYFGFGETLAHRLSRMAPGLSITVVPDKNVPRRVSHGFQSSIVRFSGKDVGLATLAVAVASVVGLAIYEMGLGTVVLPMLYLLTIVLLSRFASTVTYSLVAAMAGMFAYNFFFTVPRFSFQAHGASYPLIFVVLALGGLVVSLLTVRMKKQNEAMALRSYRTEVLIDSSRRLRTATSADECLSIAARQAMKLFNRPVVMYETNEQGHVGAPRVYDQPGSEGDEAAMGLTEERERAVAAWVASNDERAGATTNTLVDAKCLYLPIHGRDRVHGVAGVAIGPDDDFGSFEKNLMLAILEETGQTMERIALFQESQAMRVKAETESLRSNLLRSVSHDLRTPLTSISGNADVLLREDGRLDPAKRRRLYRDIHEDALWLVDLVENLLAVTRAEEGRLDLSIQPEVVGDVVAEAVRHCERHAEGHKISISLEDDLLLAEMDAHLIVQVLTNLVSNAVNYTPAGSSIVVSARRRGKLVELAVTDNGPGISDEEKQRVFDLFYNGSHVRADRRRGLGLGLALCKSIVERHGGSIGVHDARPHGSMFWFTLPAVDAPRQVRESRANASAEHATT